MIGIVRRQDTEGIHAITSVWIDGQNNVKGETSPDGPDDMGWTLGNFSTPEAAIVELDRIHQWITDGAKGVYQVGEG